jgi:ArsR family transcriptional regulator
MKETDVIKALTALAQSSRLRIFRTLVVTGSAGLTPSELSQQLDVSGATLSFHLKELMNAALISQTRNGRNLIYRAQFNHMNDLLAYLTANCCQGQPCVDVASVRCEH